MWCMLLIMVMICVWFLVICMVLMLGWVIRVCLCMDMCVVKVFSIFDLVMMVVSRKVDIFLIGMCFSVLVVVCVVEVCVEWL